MDQTTLLILYVVVAGGAFWFFGRKQRQRVKEMQERMDAIKPGDSVVTIGGLHGVIEKVNREDQTVELNCEGVILVFEKRAIHHVIPTAAPTNLEVRTEEVATEEE